jgi:hypothetical protein
VKKLDNDESFGFQPASLQKYLTKDNFFEEQRKDPKLEIIIDKLERNYPVGRYFIKEDILCKGFPGMAGGGDHSSTHQT